MTMDQSESQVMVENNLVELSYKLDNIKFQRHQGKNLKISVNV